MPEIQGLPALRSTFQTLTGKAKKAYRKKVVVGFTANYAVYVHEDMQAKHTNGQAKFLEQPVRTKQNEIRDIILKALQQNIPMDQALLLGGLHLQREAQKLTPVDTGNLRNSAFTRLEE